MRSGSSRTWIWASLVVQFLGDAYDAVWHGLLNPAAEPQTVGEMARHLARVHLPLYIGAAAARLNVHGARAPVLRQKRAHSF